MSSWRRLIRNLSDELNLQQRLLEVLTREREALKRLKTAELQAIKEEKEYLLSKSVESEKKRQETFAGLLAVLKLGEPAKLSEIIDLCDEATQRSELEIVRAELKEIATNVAEENAINGQLARDASGVVATTLSIIRSSAVPASPAYSPSGKLIEEQPDTLSGLASRISKSV